MNTTVHITGTSSGLGRALALHFAELENCTVVGYSRREGPKHSNYKHIIVDLNDPSSQESLAINLEAEREILINNAGWIGPVQPVGNLDPSEVSRLFELNVSAVMRWTNFFVDQSAATHKTVVSISSGAGKYAIPSWSAYCASKAAVDMMTSVWNEDRQDIQFLSIAPGVVDTEMQASIRSSTQEDFPEVERFKSMHENGDLQSPAKVAALIAKQARCPEEALGYVFSIRDLS